jgi:penicillin-binding protein 1A
MRSTTFKWVGLALLGIVISAAVAVAASSLVSRQIGLSSESISAGDALVPAGVGSSKGKGQGGQTTSATTPTTPSSPPTTTAPPETTFTPPPTTPVPPAPDGGDDSGGGSGHGADD